MSTPFPTHLRQWATAVLALLLLTLTSCSGDDDSPRAPRTAATVCDHKLSGPVFGRLLGDDGVRSEDTSHFHPTKWRAGGYCWLHGTENRFISVSYLWKKTLKNKPGTSPSPTPSAPHDTFTVGSTTGTVADHRASIDMPCEAPGVFKKGEVVLNVEVMDMPPYQPFDRALRRHLAEAGIKATHYLAGEVFACPAGRSS
ncbi:hypothetical protein ABII15_23640 [Streptomyces sp. HUAS MG91]|uniref:Lipoprotein n=1 Tax=Streptomyces tabacisoli TaxID=3156398 RepID=A0AAU8IVY2_9ACTN